MFRLYLLLICLIFFTGCQSVKDGLTGEKRTGADEFLVEKKNPLVLPPNFGELPNPSQTEADIQEEKSNEIQKLLSKDTDSSKDKNVSSSNLKIEESVLKKIKNK